MEKLKRSTDTRPSRARISGYLGCVFDADCHGLHRGARCRARRDDDRAEHHWRLDVLDPPQRLAGLPGRPSPAIGMVDGVVRLRGAIRGPSATSAIAFKIPSTFRSPDCFVLRAAMGTSSGGSVNYGCDLFGGQAPGTFHMMIHQDGYDTDAEPGPEAKAFTSLDGLSYDKDVYGATPIFLTGGWAATYAHRMGGSGSEGGNAIYVKKVGNHVRLQGHISAGTSSVIGRLPTLLIPDHAIWMPITLCDSYGRLTSLRAARSASSQRVAISRTLTVESRSRVPPFR